MERSPLGRLATLLRALLRPSVLVGLGFVLILALQGVLVQHGITQLRAIGRALDEVVLQAIPAEQHAQDMQRAAQNRIMLLLRMVAEPDPLEREPDARAFEAEGLAFGRARDALLGMELPAEARAQLQALLEHAVALSQVQRALVQALLEGRDDDVRTTLVQQRVFERQRELVQRLQRLTEQQRARAAQARREAARLQRDAERVVLGLGVSLFILGLGIGAVVTRLTSRAERLMRDEMERSRTASITDPLTGLLNRRGLEAERQRWVEEGIAGPHTVMLIDLDRFKPINDEAGHDAGDAALKRVAQLLLEQVRPQDRVARLGGDEFGILLRGLALPQAAQVAQRIVDTLSGFTFVWEGRPFPLGASVGLAPFTLDDARQRWPQVLKAADQACYEAKRGGRGRYAAANEAAAVEPVAAGMR
ncbi:MAG: GGDEF domain-containing protein [Tepidimonas sp.]|nr:GGDEF domain-containing protein [Tepidimonas sp.]